jgi:hypothetical protein
MPRVRVSAKKMTQIASLSLSRLPRSFQHTIHTFVLQFCIAYSVSFILPDYETWLSVTRLHSVMTGWLMNVEQLVEWELTVRQRSIRRKPAPYVHHKSHMTPTEIEPGLQHCEAPTIRLSYGTAYSVSSNELSASYTGLVTWLRKEGPYFQLNDDRLTL